MRRRVKEKGRGCRTGRAAIGEARVHQERRSRAETTVCPEPKAPTSARFLELELARLMTTKPAASSTAAVMAPTAMPATAPVVSVATDAAVAPPAGAPPLTMAEAAADALADGLAPEAGEAEWLAATLTFALALTLAAGTLALALAGDALALAIALAGGALALALAGAAARMSTSTQSW